MKSFVVLSTCLVMLLVTDVIALVEACHHTPIETHSVPCYNCGGSGICASCGGSGEIIFERWENGYTVQDVFPCNDCYGSGRCQICYGSGML